MRSCAEVGPGCGDLSQNQALRLIRTDSRFCTDSFDRNWNFTGPDDLIKTTGPGPKSISDLPESMISENVVILEVRQIIQERRTSLRVAHYVTRSYQVRSDSHEAEELVDFPGKSPLGASSEPSAG